MSGGQIEVARYRGKENEKVHVIFANPRGPRQLGHGDAGWAQRRVRTSVKDAAGDLEFFRGAIVFGLIGGNEFAREETRRFQ